METPRPLLRRLRTKVEVRRNHQRCVEEVARHSVRRTIWCGCYRSIRGDCDQEGWDKETCPLQAQWWRRCLKAEHRFSCH